MDGAGLLMDFSSRLGGAAGVGKKAKEHPKDFYQKITFYLPDEIARDASVVHLFGGLPLTFHRLPLTFHGPFMTFH